MKSAGDVEIESLKKADDHMEARLAKLESRVGMIETAIAWVIGAAVGIAGLASAIKTGILKAMVS
jgi:hypothetical protein